MLRSFLGASCALVVSLILVAPASAVPDGPLDVYLEHLEPLALAWPADGTLTSTYGPRWGQAHVVPGQWVVAGESIGEAGCTGSCTGTHLHFELRRHGVPVDPAPFFG